MVNSVSAPSTNVKTSIFYINDIHGQVPKMEQITSASTQFDSYAKQQKSDALKLSSGDIFIGGDKKTNQVAANFLQTAGIQATTIGNHEIDGSVSTLAGFISNIKTKFLGMNMNIPDDSKLNGKVARSTIIEENGNKYGIIGLQPIDIMHRIKSPKLLEGITIDNEQETLKELQEEVDGLEKQGVNKVIVLSHTGNVEDKKIAQTVKGVDVILGGHSHDLIKGIKEGENLFYTSTGDPVVITQAGRDGHNFGVLDLEFDASGKIKKAENSVIPTKDYSKSLIMTTQTDKILGPSPQIGVLKNSPGYPKNSLIEENACADFVADAVKKELGADIVLINSANFRGNLVAGSITARDISSIFPFKNRLCKVQITEKELIDALNHGGTSLKSPDNKPNIMQVSGMTYTLNKDGKVVEATYIDNNNQKHSIDVNNPDPNKKYTAIYDDFICQGNDKFTMLNKMDSLIEYYEFDKDKVTSDYISKLNNQPFEIAKDGRITIQEQ